MNQSSQRWSFEGDPVYPVPGSRAEGSAWPAQPHWFVCYTKARHEKRVEAQLRELGLEAYLPLLPTVRRWHDRSKVVPLPLFPSYVFVRCVCDSLSRVLATPGVTTIVHFNGAPARVPDSEIRNLQRLTRACPSPGLDVRPTPFRPGRRVKVGSGAFAGVEGILVEHRTGTRVLVQVGLESLGQGLKLEVDGRVLRPVAPDRAAVRALREARI